MEEERRLAYVGMTRAQERLYLTHAKQRMLYGQTNSMSVSPFVKEIPQELICDLGEQQQRQLEAAHERLRLAGLGRSSVLNQKSAGSSPPPFSVGDRGFIRISVEAWLCSLRRATTIGWSPWPLMAPA